VTMTSSQGSSAVITSLNRNDVLLGRGSGPNHYYGNLQFRDLVEQRREAYAQANLLAEKRGVAQSIVDDVRARGGRFLRQQGQRKKGENVLTDGEWIEVNNSVALEKSKQALRENKSEGAAGVKKPKKSASLKRPAENTAQNELLSAILTSNSAFAAHAGVQTSVGSILSPPTAEPTTPAMLSSLMPSMLARGNAPAVAPMDAHLLLFQSAPFSLQQQQQQQPVLLQPNPILQLLQTEQFNQTFLNPYRLTSVPAIRRSAGGGVPPELLQGLGRTMNVATAAANTSSQADDALFRQFRDSFNLQPTAATPEHHPFKSIENALKNGKLEQIDEAIVVGEATEDDDADEEDVAVGTASTRMEEDDVAAFLLSSLAVSDRKVMTEEQEAMERANLSDEDKAAVLADLYGSYCSESAPQNKKARKDLDRASIAFLVRLMRAELDNIPADKKPALVEAQKKARPDEFSDARLEKFLRCVGMNTKVRSFPR